MTRIDRDDFSRRFAERAVSIDVSRPAPAVASALRDIDVSSAELRSVAGADRVIRGRPEFEALYDRLSELDRTRPVPEGTTDRATRLLELLAPRSATPSVDAPTGVRGAGPTSASPTGVGISGVRRARPVADEPTTPTPARAPVSTGTVGAPTAGPTAVATSGPTATPTPATATTTPPVEAAPEPARLVATGRREGGRETFVRTTAAEEATVARLRALPPAPATRGHAAPTPVSAYLDALDRRAALAELRASGTRPSAAEGARPAGVPAAVWNESAALERQGLTAADARAYLATGALPDLLDRDGTVLATGAERFARLERAASREGSWTAVNSFTVLVGMRRSALAAERTAAQAELDAMPADAPERAELSARIEASRALDTSLNRGLQGLYTAATYARERTGVALTTRADRLDRDAARLRDSGDTAGAARLEAQATTTRDRAARMALAEGEYRAGLRGTGWDAASPFAVAAEAQLGRGRAEVAALTRDPTTPLPSTPPASLGTARDAGNGVPGAGALLDRAREVRPASAGEHRYLALDAARLSSTADFHGAHLTRGHYFDRPTDRTPPPRSAELVAHRTAYVEARAGQSEALGRRLDLYDAAARASGPSATTRTSGAGAPARLTAADALDASRVAAERRHIVDELGESLATSLASDRGLSTAETRATELRTAVGEARTAVTEAEARVTRAEEGRTRAVDNDHAVIDLRTGDEARRDRGGVTDSRTVLDADRAAATTATAQLRHLEGAAASADRDVMAARDVATRDAGDAGLVRAVLARRPAAVDRSAPATSTTAEAAYTGVRREADRLATRGADYLSRAESALTTRDRGGLPARAVPGTEREVAAARIDLARYWTRSADVEASALGDAGRRGALPRLDTASGLIDAADRTRERQVVGSPERLALASGLVDARAELAEANADHRPGVSATLLARAETTSADLASSPELAARARGRVGSAAVTSLLRHDARFGEVARAGGHDATADDRLYAQAHRLIGTTRSTDTPAVTEARTRLGAIDRNLDAVSDILARSAAQLDTGAAYAGAVTRTLGRSEIQAAQAQVSVVISGGAWLLTAGTFDMREEMAQAGEGATRMRVGFGNSTARRLTTGAAELDSAWTAARLEGRPFELLGSLRLRADRELATLQPRLYGEAGRFIDARVPRDASTGARGTDWQDFLRVGIRDGEVPLARALGGSTMGLTAARDALGDRRLGVMTRDMRESTIEAQAASLTETTRNMGWIIAANTGLEVALGIVLTGGLGSAAAVGEGANALNAGRVGLQAAEVARTASTLARAGQLLTAFRAAHPVLHAVGVGTAVGVGMMGASHAARYTFGASSGAARAVDLAGNFLPIGAGHRAAGLGGAAERAVLGASTAERAVEGASTRLGALRAAVSTERLIAHARFYGPQIALGSGQAVIGAVATPALADRLGVTSDTGRALVGLALNTLMTGGVAAGMARRGAPTPAEGLTRHLTEGTGHTDTATTTRVRTDVDGFLRRTEGRMPTEAEATTLRRGLYERLGVGEGTDPVTTERRAHIDAAVEALRVDRAVSLGRVDPANPTSALDAAATRLFESRGGEAGGASRTQAFRDATDAIMARTELTPEARAALLDRTAAAELTASFATAPRDGATPVLTPAQRTGVESVLASELGTLRTALEGGASLTTGRPSAFQRLARRLETDAGLSPTAAESVLRGVQHHLVERTVVSRLATAQATATTPLTAAQMEASVRDTALRAGLPAEHAAALAPEVVSRGPFVDLIHRNLPQRFWTPELHRRHFEHVGGPGVQAEVGGLTPAQFTAVFGNEAVPFAAYSVASQRGFGAFAAAHPAEARVLVEASGVLPVEVAAFLRNPPPGATLNSMAAHLQPMLPVITPHPTMPNHVLVRRGPASPSHVPEVMVRPTTALDHNGAFHLPGVGRGRTGDTTSARSAMVDVRVMRPDQLVVNGAPLSSMDGVMVYAGHGSTSGISGLGPRDVVRNIVAQIQAAPPGSPVRTVVLDACHQRDARWGFMDSNAQAVRRELNAELARLGLPPVTVLAADRGGPTYGPRSGLAGGATQRDILPSRHTDSRGNTVFGREHRDATFDNTDTSRFYVDPMYIGIGAALAAEGGALYVFREVMDERRRAAPATGGATASPR